MRNGFAYERGHPFREQRRVGGANGAGISGHTGIDRLLAQHLQLLWNGIEKSYAKIRGTLDEPGCGLIRADHRWVVERPCCLRKLTALRGVHDAEQNRITMRLDCALARLAERPPKQFGLILTRQPAEHRDDQIVPDLIALKRRQMIGGKLAGFHCAWLRWAWLHCASCCALHGKITEQQIHIAKSRRG